ncbi:hypothetical protein [Gorillibacterium sp. sgz5001074]|uniref:hypothetical protein n=1 Tax=Gorillibacterium sp. sgz5001074 TaxID=3446695 RepID=UPI003F661EFA
MDMKRYSGSQPAEVTEAELAGDEPGYEETFAVFSAGVERMLIRAALVLAVLLAAAQLALLIPAVREAWVRVERLEGVPFGSGESSQSDS